MNRFGLLSALRRGWPVIVIALLVGAAGGFLLARSAPTRYSSTATVFVSLSRGATASDFNAGTLFAQNVTPSITALATMPVVLGPVATQLHLSTTPQDLARAVVAHNPTNTTLIDITATDPSAGNAAQLANAVAGRLEAAVSDLAPRSVAGAAALKIEITSPAVPGQKPSSTSASILWAAALGAAFVVGLGLAVLLERLRPRIYGRRELAGITDLPVLGTVPRVRRARRHPCPVVSQPGSARAEQLSVVRAALDAGSGGRLHRSVLVSSAASGDGRTSVALNLAASMSTTRRRVVLVDADLRASDLGQLARAAGEGPGLADVLRKRATTAEAIRPWALVGSAAVVIDLLPAGRTLDGETPLDPASMGRLLAELRRRYDLIVIDSGPLLSSADPLVLATQVDDLVIVCNCRTSRVVDLEEALERLHVAHVEPVGVVLNEAEPGRFRAGGRALRTRSVSDPKIVPDPAHGVPGKPVALSGGSGGTQAPKAGPVAAGTPSPR